MTVIHHAHSNNLAIYIFARASFSISRAWWKSVETFQLKGSRGVKGIERRKKPTGRRALEVEIDASRYGLLKKRAVGWRKFSHWTKVEM